MADVVIRPSLKFIRAGYAFTVLVIVAATVVHSIFLKDQPPWLSAMGVLLVLWPLERHLRRQFCKITIQGDKLRYESGVLSRSTRIIQLSKVQDVRVNQSLWQRIFDVGDASIETAGETSRLTVENIDRPQAVAEEIIDASRAHGDGATGVR